MAEKRSRPTIIGITAGDAAGVGPEVLLKALSDASLAEGARFVIYSKKYVLDDAIRTFNIPLDYEAIDSADLAGNAEGRTFLYDPIGGRRMDIEYGRVSPELSSDAMRLVECATLDALAGKTDGFTTAPINKKGIQAAGYDEKGHTGFIAGLSKTDDYAMMFVGGGLRVVLVTIHVPLRDVPAMVTREAVYRKILLTDRALREWFGIERPRIGVCGLNPHAGEEGVIGREDSEEILPAIRDSAARKVCAAGPFPADTIFNRCREGHFDAVIAMYHDQGLIPVKALSFGSGVNVTIGLPFIRTSPDHGTAYDLAGKGVADPKSMMQAIRLAVELSRNRSRSARSAT